MPCATGTSVDLRATTRPDALVASHLRSSFRLCAAHVASPSPHRRLPRVVPPGFDAARQHAVDACEHLAQRIGFELGRAHVRTQVTNAHTVFRLLLEHKTDTSPTLPTR